MRKQGEIDFPRQWQENVEDKSSPSLDIQMGGYSALLQMERVFSDARCDYCYVKAGIRSRY